MRVFHLFIEALPLSETDRGRLHRVSRAGGHLLKIARHGAKVSPAAIWVDAALAVCDAAQAWARYEQAREITRQLESDCDTLRHLCANVLRRLALEEKAVRSGAQTRLDQVNQRLRDDRRDSEWLTALILQRRALIEQLRGSVEALRAATLQAPQALLDLEASVETLVRAQLQTLLDSQLRGAREQQP